MVTTVFSSSLVGMDGIAVRVETDVANGLPSFQIVGLGDAAVQESRERVRSAIRNSGFSFPAKRVTVNLAPADVRKSGPAFDLAVALSIVAEEAGIPESAFDGVCVLGELALDGTLRSVGAAVAHVASAKERGIRKVLLPFADAAEAAEIPEMRALAADSLPHAVAILKGTAKPGTVPKPKPRSETFDVPDFHDVLGQGRAKRALEIAAAWGHNVLLEGPPGSGKTLLCRAFPGILPEPGWEELLQIAKIRSVAGQGRTERPFDPIRPFRTVHPSASVASVVGGGFNAGPGEISLAHLWVLFLDEMREFPSRLLESLRQPMEDGAIAVSRANAHVTYPARFQLLAAANPCPCGYLGDRQKPCSCQPGTVERYRAKLSWPVLDRIDLFVSVPRLPSEELANKSAAEPSSRVRERVIAARKAAEGRLGAGRTNATLSPSEIGRFLRCEKEAEAVLMRCVDRLGLSSRAFFRIKKVARTIADLAESETVTAEHVGEAAGYRER